MSEKEKQILKTFEKILPNLSDSEQENLLCFGEGMAFMKNGRKQEEGEKDDKFLVRVQ